LRILILGSDNFAPALRDLGQEVLTCAPMPEADIALPEDDPDWRDLERILRGRGQRVDAVLVTDDVGRRRLPTGLWAAGAVTAFYGVDSPLNRFWQWPYARLFDAAWLDQPEEARGLGRLHPKVGWLPVGIDPALYEGGEKEAQTQPGVCFVGVVNESVRPKRSALLRRVAKAALLTVRGGRKGKWFPTQEAARMYRRFYLTLNENLFPGLTTRSLEVMAAGGVLLSEAAPGALDRYFQGGLHLDFFGPDDLEQKLEYYLGHQEARGRLAEAGRAAVRAGHTLKHRAEEIVRVLTEMARLPMEERPRARGGQALGLEGQALLMAGLRWPAQNGPNRLARARGRLGAAAQNGQKTPAGVRAAGLALAAMGQWDQALGYLAKAAEAGRAGDRLNLALAAQQVGQGGMAGDVLKSLAGDYPGLLAGPGRAAFHLAAARLLLDQGLDLSPGFSRRGLAMPFWTACEHLQEAAAQEPDNPRAWEDLGDLLLKRSAANQAHDCFARARQLTDTAALAAKQAAAAREGYLA